MTMAVSDKKPRVILWIPVDLYKNAVLPEVSKVSGIELIVTDDPAQLPDILPQAEGMISSGASRYTADVAKAIATHGTKLRWFQTVAAGNDGLVMHGIPSNVVVTGSGGHSAPVVAEHALALLMATSHCMPDIVRNTAEASWNKDFRPRYRSLFGKTAVVVGMGRIGQEITKRLKAFDMKVIGVTRSGAAHPGLDAAAPVSALCSALAEADAAIIAAPLTPETTGLFGAREFAAMKPGGFLVNISRGKMIDQAALHDALTSGHLAGAGLDVTDPEPLPGDDPLWGAPNLIVSPHIAGSGSTESPKRLAAAVLANLDALLGKGEGFKNILPFGKHAA